MHAGNDREELLCKHPYASISSKSKGRSRDISSNNEIRTEFQRDTHRIVYSQPFRRLKHKTQVFYLPDNDHVCTRMEHSINVAAAARTVARALALNEDLAEAIGLGHDLGHAPFGHHGEEILSEIGKKHGIVHNFHHEVNSLRQIDRLAQMDREPEPGLALTWETRDGIVSHNGEEFSQERIVPYSGEKDLDEIYVKMDAKNPSTLEGCIVRVCDKIAYAGRDLEDGLQTGFIKEEKIPHEVTSILGRNNGEIVGTLIRDIIESSPKDDNYIELSQDKFQALKTLMKFNHKNIYLTPRVQKYKTQASTALTHLFEQLRSVLEQSERFENSVVSNELITPMTNGHKCVNATLRDFVKDLGYDDSESNARIVIDFLSGCTDNYILRITEEVFVPKAIV